MNNEIIDYIIKILENKLNLTDIEKDILDSYHILQKNPIDRDGIIKQIRTNKKYNTFMEEVSLAEYQTGGKVVSVSIEKLPNDQLVWNLNNQLLILCSKMKNC